MKKVSLQKAWRPIGSVVILVGVAIQVAVIPLSVLTGVAVNVPQSSATITIALLTALTVVMGLRSYDKKIGKDSKDIYE